MIFPVLDRPAMTEVRIAGAAAQVHWVGAGLRWRYDAVGCPSCDGRIDFDDAGGWACATGCGFARPELAARLEMGDDGVARGVWSDGRIFEIALRLPGRFNAANALMAAVAAEAHGVAAESALAAMVAVDEVAGRFTTRAFGPHRARLMLAKNPAGWSELLDLVARGDAPLVVSINARIADGADPSWLWDVPFERLGGRPVVATGDRCRDLSVRLQYAGVDHVLEPDPLSAVARAAEHAHESGGDGGRDPDRVIDAIGNYTAFHDLLEVGP